MIKFLTLLSSLFFAASVYAADVTDTVGDAGSSCHPCSYSTLVTAAAQNLDLSTAQDNHTIECYEMVDNISATVLIAGWTTTADTYELTIKGADSDKSADNMGKYSDERYRIEDAAQTVIINSQDSNINIEYLQVKSTNGSGASFFRANSADTGMVLLGNIYQLTGTNSIFLDMPSAGPTVSAYHNLSYNDAAATGNRGRGSWIVSGTANIYNHTHYDGAYGYVRLGGTLNVYNSIDQSSATSFFGTVGGNYNITDAASGAPGANSKHLTTITFVSATSPFDFHVDPTETDHLNCGNSTAGCDQLVYLVDIDGGTREAQWDIGADETGVGYGPPGGGGGFNNYIIPFGWKQIWDRERL